tara:strand:- start:358 stop:633 length:276 start_codon:yes stop_codon:yes gene_type:complete
MFYGSYFTRRLYFIVINWKNSFNYVITISFFLIIFGILSVKNSNSEKYKDKIIKDYGINLKACIDLENKNKRRINESLELIKYCIKEFGID